MGRFCSPAFMGLACAEDDGGPFRFPPLGLLPSTTGRDGWCFPGRFLPIRDRRGADCRFWRSRDGRCPAASFLPLLLVKLAEGERHASVLGTGKVHHLGRRPRARWALARDWGRRGRRGRFSGVVGDGEQLGCGAPAHSGRHPSFRCPERFPKGVDRTRSDIAKDDTERAQHKRAACRLLGATKTSILAGSDQTVPNRGLETLKGTFGEGRGSR
jgi:hypothetical protein